MKKIFGIALALTLVLSMTVMAIPAAGAGTIVCSGVVLSNPLVSPMFGPPQLSDYTLNFTIQEPVTNPSEYIDITFPATTTFTNVATVGPPLCDVSIWSPAGGILLWSAGDFAVNTLLGTTLRLTLAAPNNIFAGPVGVVVECVGNPTDQCEHTLCVGTTAETCSDCPPYDIYAFRIDLCKGWNLISLPVIPDDPDIEVVLAHLIANQVGCCADFSFKVYFYDCATWYAYNNDSYTSLTTMTECHAYWIWVSDDKSFYVKGEYYPDPPAAPLKKCYHECWNMVGFTSNCTRDPLVTNSTCCGPYAAYMESLSPPGTVVYILGWNCTTQSYYSVVQAPNGGPCAAWTALNCLIPGQGYWMAFSQDACFAVPPPGV